MRRLAISQLTTRRWSVDEDVNGYSRAGVPGIGVYRPKLEAYGVERGLRLLKDSGLGVSSLVAAGPFTSPDPKVRQGRIQDAKVAIELAARMKADCLLLSAGPAYGQSWEEAKALLKDSLLEVAEAAAQARVRLALEPVHPMLVELSMLVTLSDALDTVETVRSPYLGILFDVYHLWWDHRLTTEMARARGKIHGVQISDWPAGAKRMSGRVVMGEGIIPLKQMLALVEGTGFNGFWEAEVLSEELWALDHEVLIERIKAGFKALEDAR
jgi:sugar phosphate isomerase/epimerase